MCCWRGSLYLPVVKLRKFWGHLSDLSAKLYSQVNATGRVKLKHLEGRFDGDVRSAKKVERPVAIDRLAGYELPSKKRHSSELV